MNKTEIVKFRVSKPALSDLEYQRTQFCKSTGISIEMSAFLRFLIAKGLTVLKKELR